jgi:inorganic pyrophosphatase
MPKPSKRSAPKDDPDPITVIVETPRGSRNKYKLDEETGRMKLSKVMPVGMVFPYDFGFIPETEGEDGDPLDVLILSDAPSFSGCQVDCRLIGTIQARQREKNGKEMRNDRIVAVAQASVHFASIKELAELEPLVMEQLDEFFINYQKVRDVEVSVVGHKGSEQAMQTLRRASKRKAEGKPQTKNA